MAILELHGVSKTYGTPGRTPAAIDDVTFSIDGGEFALLTGPSGAGKTTVLRLILAMERPDRGTIRVAGRDIGRLSGASIPYLRRNLGAVFQDFKLLPEAAPCENVALALHVLGLGSKVVRERARAALARLGIDPDRRTPVRQLSGGEQQRVALARAIAGEPAVLLADEPTGNLDPELTRDILGVIGDINRHGTTVVVATHDPAVMAYADGARVLRLVGGRLEDRADEPAAVADRDGPLDLVRDGAGAELVEALA